MSPGELVLEIGPGRGALTRALLRRGVDVLAIEADHRLARDLPSRMPREYRPRLKVVSGDFRSAPLPSRAFRVVASLPFGATTDVLRRILDDPQLGLDRADLIVQWEVACKRAAAPPSTLRCAAWAPWWAFELGPRISAQHFRPIPSVDAGVLVIRRREPPLLPGSMAADYARFVRAHWPFHKQAGNR